MSSGSRISIDRDTNGILDKVQVLFSFTLTSVYTNYLIESIASSALTITMPDNTVMPYTTPKSFLVSRATASKVLFAAMAGVTILGGITEIADTATTTGGMVSITHSGVNEFYINGKEV